ncbi:unnamed protein product [Linum trigynum]|uniref:F-box domain-containing protein n=1 Tax=Linum trigynum TaxID=586398 RepID=A0AAV2GKX0_9ROSI
MAANRGSGTPVDKLLDDLLIDILVRLPNPRSVSRCKLVCKRWSLLLSSPGFNRRFVSDHWSRNQQPPLLLSSDDRESNILSFLPMPWRRYFGILDSHNDLVLCGFEGVTPYNHAPELYRSYFVCNPFSKQWVALPLAPQVPVSWNVAAARLVCEPRGSANLAVGQCLVYSEYRFRVVCIYGDTGIGWTMLRVFSSDTGEWTKEILSIPNHMPNLLRKSSPNNSCPKLIG